MTDLLFIILGFFFGFVWFSVAVLPVFYGLPKAVIWVLRRWSVWRGTVILANHASHLEPAISGSGYRIHSPIP